jgi:hypothetical protein
MIVPCAEMARENLAGGAADACVITQQTSSDAGDCSCGRIRVEDSSSDQTCASADNATLQIGVTDTGTGTGRQAKSCDRSQEPGYFEHVVLPL